MNKLKDYLKIREWQNDYLMARLYREYWGLGFSIDDLQNDLMKIAGQSKVVSIIRQIEIRVEGWSTEKGAPDKTDVVSRYSYDPNNDEEPIVYYGGDYWTDESLELAELEADIFMDEAELSSIIEAVEKGRSEKKRYSIDGPEVQNIFDEIKKMDDE